mmetsp:Transcript_43646/g.70187  ORF Transcript_43646/g.70187 Transcript_43646/m.70187 type:complete len:111 (+) Transcript_43646:969-1301(+)
MDDKNLKPVNDSWHRRIPNVVYHGMDWLCPGYSVVLQNKLEEHRTSLTPELVINDVISIVQTGDLHAVVYDLTEMTMYVANARGSQETGPQKAYDRTFTRFNMTELFELS